MYTIHRSIRMEKNREGLETLDMEGGRLSNVRWTWREAGCPQLQIKCTLRESSLLVMCSQALLHTTQIIGETSEYWREYPRKKKMAAILKVHK